MAPPPEPQPRADPAGLQAGYETLREAVLAGAADGWRHGHGVLAGRGMAAWIATWTALAPAGAGTMTDPSHPVSSAPQPTSPQPSNTLSSLPAAGQVVTVLAEMALAHL